MKYELRENQGIPAPLLALMAVATGLSVANCYYNQPLLGSMAKEFAVSDFSASMVATLTQIGYVVGLVFVIPLGDLDSRKKLIQTNYIISLCALLAIALAPNIYWVWGASLVAGASSVMPQFFIPLVSYHSTPSRKVRNVGIIQSCLLIGILGSRVFSGLLADEWGWRSVYLVASVFMLGCFLLIHGMLPELSARSRENYAGLMKSLLRLLLKYPYLQIASLRAALAYGSFFALWSCLAFRMKQAPFFAGDDMIGALGLCGLAGASTVVFISGYVQKYGARFFSVAGGCVLLAAWLLAFWGNDSYLWIIIAILLIDGGMQCIHLSNQTSVVALDASAINRINTVYMTIYFLGGSAGTFVSGLSWQHYGWTGVVGVGVAFTVASLLVNCIKPNGKPQTGRVGFTCET